MKSNVFFNFLSLTIVVFLSGCSKSLFITYYKMHFNQNDITTSESLIPGVSSDKNYESDTEVYDFLIIKCSDTTNKCKNDTLLVGYHCFALELRSRILCKVTYIERANFKPRQIIKAKKINFDRSVCTYMIINTYPGFRDADGPTNLYTYPLIHYYIQLVEDSTQNK